MSQTAKLALEDGTVFTGMAFGAEGEVDGEVCFNTSMTGYQEILTDPSYRGQIVTMTYPEIGNYGVNSARHGECPKAALCPASWCGRDSRRASNFRSRRPAWTSTLTAMGNRRPGGDRHPRTRAADCGFTGP